MFRRSLTMLVCVLVLIPNGWCTCGAAFAGCPKPTSGPTPPQPSQVKPAAGCSCRHAAPGGGHAKAHAGESPVRVSQDHRAHGGAIVPLNDDGHQDRHSPDCGTVTPKVPNGVSPPKPVLTEPVLVNWFAAAPAPAVTDLSLPLPTSPFPARTPVYLALNVLRI